MPIKTWTIRKKSSSYSNEVASDSSQLKVGDEVILRTFDSPYYITTNKLKYFKDQSEPGRTTDCIFKIFANDNSGIPITDTNVTIKNGMEVGLRCNSTNSFLSIMSGTDGQYFVTTSIVNNAFTLYSPNLLDDANVVDNTPIQLYSSTRILTKSDTNELTIPLNNFDDNFMNKNFPFLLMSLFMFKKLGFGYTTTFNCPGTFIGPFGPMGIGNPPLTTLRCTPPPGYLPLSDVSICNLPDRNIEVVFCKASNPWNPAFPFCRQVTAIKSMSNNFDNGISNSVDSETIDRCVNQTPSRVYHMIGSPITISGVVEYIPVGTCVQTSSISIPPWAAIHRQFIERVNSGLTNYIERTTVTDGDFDTRNKQFHYNTIVSGSEPYNRQTSTNEAIWNLVNNKGRLFVKNWGQHDRFEHEFTWSDTSIIDERESSHNTAWKWLNPYKGFMGDLSEAAYEGLIRGFIVKTDAYLLRSIASLQKLCSTQNSNEHYWNQYTVDRNTTKDNLLCQDFRSSFCGGNNRNKYNFHFFTLDSCQTYCKETLDGSIERTNCKTTYTDFCNLYRVLPDGTKDYYNYYDYPHICACFTNQPEFSKPLCNTLADSKRILYNDVARTSARIADPFLHTVGQCDKPCIFNPDKCKNGAKLKTNDQRQVQVLPVSQDDNTYKEVVTLDTTREALCSATICVNEIFADITTSGNATFNVSQECNLQGGGTFTPANAICITDRDINQGFCTAQTDICRIVDSRATVVFFPATGVKDDPSEPANFYSIYKTIRDAMSGACGTGGDQKFAGTVSKTYNLSTVQGKKTLEYTTKGQSPSTNDLQDIGQVLLTRQTGVPITNTSGFNTLKIPDQNKLRIEIPYTNCVLDWSPTDTGPNRCTFDTVSKQWKELQVKDQIITQPTNGGTGCSNTVDFGLVAERECTLPKNCKLAYGGTGVFSSDGTQTYLYDVLEYNTPGGTGCDDYRTILNATGSSSHLTSTDLQNTLLSTSLRSGNILGISYPYPSCNLVTKPANSTGSCYFTGFSSDKNPIYKKDLVYQYEITTNGGIKNIGCTPSQTAMYGTRFTQECTGTCQFTGPSATSCDIRTGTKVSQYTVKRKAEPDEVLCGDIYPAYLESQGIPRSKQTGNVRLGGENVGSILSVTERNGCQIRTDCVLEKLPDQECVNNLRQIQYKIIQQPQQGGADCLDVAKEYNKETDIIGSKVVGDKVSLTRSCIVEAPPPPKEEISTSIKLGGVILIIGIIVYFGIRRTKRTN